MHTTEISETAQTSTASVDARIAALEALFSPTIPGTKIVRVGRKDLLGFEWCLGIERMGMPKRFFTADTIIGCIDLAEAAVLEDQQQQAQDGAAQASRRARKEALNQVPTVTA